MTDLQDLAAGYCPNCGAEVDGGQSIAVGDDLAVAGTFEGRDACILVDDGQIRIFAHPGDDR